MSRACIAEDDQHSAEAMMTESFIIRECKKHQGYSTPELNEKLYLHHFGFSHLGGLESFTGCTVLYLSHNGLTSLSELSALSQLDSLYLSSNALTSLSTLPRLPSLRTLDVAENVLTSLAGLDEAAPELKTLLASRNQLSRLTGVQGCTDLLSLDVSFNQLVDEEKTDSALRPLRGGLRTLMLHGNELCRTAGHYRKRWIVTFPALKFLDEYPVFDDERERAVAFVRGGVGAEESLRRQQRARTAAEAAEQFRHFTDLCEAQRAARRRDGAVTETTAYFRAHAATLGGSGSVAEEEDDIYIPMAGAQHADPVEA